MNPVLRELGFAAGDRVVVVHADDIGMCYSTLPAIDELMAFGVVTSASAMVPCPWFLDVVAWHQRNTQFDLGIHLTLTSEWERYRWGPISTRAQSSGLLDNQGCFHGTSAAVRRHANREAVGVEMRRQIELAERLGLAPTHIDNHMFVAMCDEFVEDYFQIGCERGIPAFMTRAHGNSPGEQKWFRQRAMQWENQALPAFDCWQGVTRRGDVESHDAFVRQVFDHLPVGLSCVLLHPAIDTPEIRHITDEWQGRVADYEAFRQPSLREHIRDLGIQLISYRPLRDVMRRRLKTCSYRSPAIEEESET
jgi:chitin disaccharide deacetylase